MVYYVLEIKILLAERLYNKVWVGLGCTETSWEGLYYGVLGCAARLHAQLAFRLRQSVIGVSGVISNQRLIGIE